MNSIRIPLESMDRWVLICCLKVSCFFSNYNLLDAIHPYNWASYNEFCSAQSDTFDSERCKKERVVPGVTVCITYWSHSWANKGTSI